MTDLPKNRIIAIIIIFVLGALTFTAFAIYFKTVTINTLKPQTAGIADLAKIKCQAGLLAPQIDKRSCPFKDIAAGEIEKRGLCNKKDAKAALDIACQEGFKLPDDLAAATTSNLATDKPGVKQPASGNCNAKSIAAQPEFVQNKALACSSFMDVAADQVFKDPRAGCKTKDQALKEVKKACAGDFDETSPVQDDGSPDKPLGNLVNCESIASSITELIKKQPSLCSSASSIPTEYIACTKEIIAAATPICLGAGSDKSATALSGSKTKGQECDIVAQSLYDTVRKDTTLCTASVPDQYSSCTGKIIAKLTPFCAKLQPTYTAKGGVIPGDQCDIVAESLYDTVRKDLSLCNTSVPDQYSSCTRQIIPKLTPLCAKAMGSGSTKSSKDSLTAQQECEIIADSIYETVSEDLSLCNSPMPDQYSSCTRQIIPRMTRLCAKSMLASVAAKTTGGGSTSANECQATADSLYTTVKANISLCTSPIPAQFASCTEQIVKTLTPLCSGSTPPSANAKCDGPSVAGDNQFKQSAALACGAGRDIAASTIESRTGSPCKGNLEGAKKALDEACKIIASTPGGAPVPGAGGLVCNGALIASSGEFQASKALACGDYKNIAIQKAMSQPGSPCKDEATTMKALNEACTGTTSTGATGTGAFPRSATQPAGSSSLCPCDAIATNAEFQKNAGLACKNQGIAAQQISNISQGACSQADASSALQQICGGTCKDASGRTIAAPTSGGTVPFYSIGGGSGSAGGFCTCDVIASSDEFKSKASIACKYKPQAASQIVQSSGGACDTGAATEALNKICSGQCTDSSGKKIAAPAAGSGGSFNSDLSSYCTCDIIATDEKFKSNAGLACKYKAMSVPQIVSGSQGACDNAAATAALDQICSGQCKDSAGNAIAAPDGSGADPMSMFASMMGGGGGGMMSMFQSMMGGGGGGMMDMFSSMMGGGGGGMMDKFAGMMGGGGGGGGIPSGGGGVPSAGSGGGGSPFGGFSLPPLPDISGIIASIGSFFSGLF